MTDKEETKLLLSKERAAHVLDTSVSKFEELVRTGAAPKGRQFGKRGVRWLWSEIQAFAERLPIANMLPPEGCGYGRAGKPKGE